MTDDRGVGLCASCRYTKLIETRTGSRFYYCRRSDEDERFVRYPGLPVIECVGYEKKSEEK